MTRLPSAPEQLLAVQLDQAGIPYEREYHFADKKWTKANGFLTPTGRGKDWRADFALWQFFQITNHRDIEADILVEIDGGGYVAGRHSRGTGIENDAEKQSAAAILGYRVIRCTPRQVESGLALSWIRQALGMEEAA